MSLAPIPTNEVQECHRLMRDGVINYSGPLVSGMVGILLVPIMLQSLGPELYGLWLAAMSVTGLASALDLGFEWGVVREVAAARTDETIRFMKAAFNAFVVSGLVGALLISFSGVALSGRMHLSAQTWRIAPSVFVLVGLGFIADEILMFANAALEGLRRFDVSNLLAVATTLIRTAGIVILLKMGASLLPVAAWCVVASGIVGFAALKILRRFEPRFGPRMSDFKWNSLRPHIRFALLSQVNAALSKIIWESTPVLIGLIRGSAAIVPYHIGQKFPFGISRTTDRIGGVVFPAASEHGRTQNVAGTRQVLEIGTRWTTTLALPLCLTLWILAPTLLQAWLGQAPADTVLITRLTTAAVLVDSLAVAPIHVLWGRGAVGTVLLVQGITGAVGLGLSVWLLMKIGIVGAACGLLSSLVVGTLVYLRLASNTCGIGILHLLRTTLKGLVLPAAACAVAALAGTHLTNSVGWLHVITISSLAGTVYLLAFYFCGAKPEERVFLRDTWDLPVKTASAIYLRFLIGPSTNNPRSSHAGLSISEKIRWRTNLFVKKATGRLGGITWWSLLCHILKVPIGRLKTPERVLKLVSSTNTLETFATPWGLFSAPRPAQEVLQGLLREIFYEEGYENSEVVISAGDVVIDCGSHVGVFARFALRRGAARVVCIEMDDLNFSCLCENIASESQRTLAFHEALWSRPTSLNFIPGFYSDCHRVAEGGACTYSKSARSLDEIVAQTHLGQVDFIKIDVEGAEPEVLEGALETIRRHRPKLALAVYHDRTEEARIRGLLLEHAIPYEFSYKTLMGVDAYILFGKPLPAV